MVDSKKRNSLKVLGVGGILATGSPVVSAALFAGAEQVTAPAGRHDALELLLIDSTSIAEDTVIVTNRTDRTIKLSGFLPGTIFYNDKHVCLNALLAHLYTDGVFRLDAGMAVSASGISPKLDHGANGDYLWAYDAAFALGVDTTLVTLAASIHDSLAIPTRYLNRLSSLKRHLFTALCANGRY